MTFPSSLRGAGSSFRTNRAPSAVAVQGSSFDRLPRVPQWFTGNIGFHRIHHLSPHIPNYNLERCHHSHPMFSSVHPTTLFSSLKSLTFRLWDEKTKKRISFRVLRRRGKWGG